MDYYIMQDLMKRGPFTLEELRARGITTDTLVQPNGSTQWMTAGNVAELAVLFNVAAPTPFSPTPSQPEPVSAPIEQQPFQAAAAPQPAAPVQPQQAPATPVTEPQAKPAFESEKTEMAQPQQTYSQPAQPQQPQQTYSQPAQPQQPQQTYSQPAQPQQPQQTYSQPAQPQQPQQTYSQPAQPQQPQQAYAQPQQAYSQQAQPQQSQQAYGQTQQTYGQSQQAYGQSQQAYGNSYGQAQTQSQIFQMAAKEYKTQSIIMLVIGILSCCCCMFNIPLIVFGIMAMSDSNKVIELNRQGQNELAQAKSASAKKKLMYGIIAGVAWMIISGVISFFISMANGGLQETFEILEKYN